MRYDVDDLSRVLGTAEQVFRDAGNEHVFTFEEETLLLLVWVFPDEERVSAAIVARAGGYQIAHVSLRNVTQCAVTVERGIEIIRIHSAGLPEASTGFLLEIHATPRPFFKVLAA